MRDMSDTGETEWNVLRTDAPLAHRLNHLGEKLVDRACYFEAARLGRLARHVLGRPKGHLEDLCPLRPRPRDFLSIGGGLLSHSFRGVLLGKIDLRLHAIASLRHLSGELLGHFAGLRTFLKERRYDHPGLPDLGARQLPVLEEKLTDRCVVHRRTPKAGEGFDLFTVEESALDQLARLFVLLIPTVVMLFGR
jgi:hypothetical protein